MTTTQANVSTVLTHRSIIWTNPPEKKSELLKPLVKIICDQAPDISLEKAFQAVMEREKVTTTFMDSGIAVPHARLSTISQIHAALAIIPNGFDSNKKFSAKLSKEAQKPKTQFVFLFLSPQTELTAHLQILSKASWIFQTQELKDKLLHMNNSEEALALIKKVEQEAPHAANP